MHPCCIDKKEEGSEREEHVIEEEEGENVISDLEKVRVVMASDHVSYAVEAFKVVIHLLTTGNPPIYPSIHPTHPTLSIITFTH